MRVISTALESDSVRDVPVFDVVDALRFMMVCREAYFVCVPIWRRHHVNKLKNMYVQRDRDKWNNVEGCRLLSTRLNHLICMNNALPSYSFYGERTIVITDNVTFEFEPSTSLLFTLRKIYKNNIQRKKEKKKPFQKMTISLIPKRRVGNSPRIPDRYEDAILRFFNNFSASVSSKPLLGLNDPIGLLHARVLHKHIPSILAENGTDVKSLLAASPHVYEKFPIYITLS